jgi:hypothetical protein
MACQLEKFTQGPNQASFVRGGVGHSKETDFISNFLSAAYGILHPILARSRYRHKAFYPDGAMRGLHRIKYRLYDA